MSMKDCLMNALWRLGSRAFYWGRRFGCLRGAEHLFELISRWIFPAPDGEVEVTAPSGVKLLLPPGYHRARSYIAGYEPAVTRAFMGFVDDGMTVVDVGAFVGWYTLVAAGRVGLRGRVWAFEPNPFVRSYLERNVDRNCAVNVTVVGRAVADWSGQGVLILDRSLDQGWLVARSAFDGIPVNVTSLDDFFAERGWPPVHLVKIDVEGAEKFVLQGMRELCARNKDLRVLMEFDSYNMRRAGYGPAELVRVLAEMGFARGYVVEESMRPFGIVNLPKVPALVNMLLERQ